MAHDSIFLKNCSENCRFNDMGADAMQRFYNRMTFIRFTLVVLFLIGYGTSAACAGAEADELRQKIADIGLLKEQLTDRIQQAEGVLAALLAQQRNLVDEVRLLQKSYDMKSYEQVKNFDRARYNIELLRSLTAYADAFAQKIQFYHSGFDKLTYLRQSAEDDIKMIQTMNNFEIDALTTQISLVINTYLREAHVIQIDPEKIELPSSESVWKKIIQKKL
jgi:hypothetical protein